MAQVPGGSPTIIQLSSQGTLVSERVSTGSRKQDCFRDETLFVAHQHQRQHRRRRQRRRRHCRLGRHYHDQLICYPAPKGVDLKREP